MSSAKYKVTRAVVAASVLAIATACSHSGYNEFGFFKSKESPSSRKIASDDDVIHTSADFQMFYDSRGEFPVSQMVFKGSPDLKVQVRVSHGQNVDCSMGDNQGTQDGNVTVFNPEALDEIICKNSGTNVEESAHVEYLVKKEVPNWSEVDKKHDDIVKALDAVKKSQYTPDVTAVLKNIEFSDQPSIFKISPKLEKVQLGSFTKEDYLEFVKADGKIGQSKQELDKSPIGPEGRLKQVRKIKNKKTGEETVVKNNGLPLKTEAPVALYCVSKTSPKDKGNVIFVGGQSGRVADPFDGDVECRFNVNWGIKNYKGELQLYAFAINHKVVIPDLEGMLQKSEDKMAELIKVRDKANSDSLNALVASKVADNNKYAAQVRTEFDVRERAKAAIEQAQKDRDDEIEKAKNRADSDIAQAKADEAEKTKDIVRQKKLDEMKLAEETRKYFPPVIVGNYYRAFHSITARPFIETKEYAGQKVQFIKVELIDAYSKFKTENLTSSFTAWEKLTGIEYILSNSDTIDSSKFSLKKFYFCPSEIHYLTENLNRAQKSGNYSLKEVFGEMALKSTTSPDHCPISESPVGVNFKRVNKFSFVYRKVKVSKRPSPELPVIDFVAYMPYRIKATYKDDKYKQVRNRYIDGEVRTMDQINALKQNVIDDLDDQVKETLVYADRRTKQLENLLIHKFFRRAISTEYLWKNEKDVPEFKTVTTDTLFPNEDSQGFVVGNNE